MEKTLLNINFRLPAYTPQENVLNGVNYLVVPVVMMNDGVHSGSGGPLYHSIEELSKPNWNDIPVVVNHPMNGGVYVSANDDSVGEDVKIGIIRNSRTVGDKLKAEAWLNITAMETYQTELLQRIRNGELIDVSVGVFTQNVPDNVVLANGDTAQYRATNHIPDHLAILPQDSGACSVDDGCGLRVNEHINTNNNKGGITMTKEDFLKDLQSYKEMSFNANELQEIAGALKPHGIGLLPDSYLELQNNQVGLLERVNVLRRLLDSMDSPAAFYYLEEILDDYSVIYRMEPRGDGTRRGPRYFRQPYTIGQNDEVSFSGNPVPVSKKIMYDDIVTTMKRTKFNINNKKEENSMAKVDELVAQLISNEATSFAEGDKDWLTTLSEEQLSKMQPKEVVQPEVNTKNPIEALSSEDKAALDYGKQQLQAHRNSLIKTITANTAEGVWAEDVLIAMDNDTLERVAKSVPQKQEAPQNAVYINGSVAPNVNADTEEILYPLGVNVEEETK